jgi:hypothetical protein
MKPSLRKSPWVLLALLFLAAPGSTSMAQAADATWGASTGEAAAMPAGLRLGATSAPHSALVKNAKLSSQLMTLAAAEQRSRSAGGAITAASLSGLPPDLRTMVSEGRMRIDGAGLVQVYVSPSGEPGAVEDLIHLFQGRVERMERAANLVQAWIPLRALAGIGADSSVKFVRLPDYGFRQTGSVTSQGDAILRANLVRSTFGVDGSGVRVGVISDGVGGLAASQATGDLPPAVNLTTCNVVSGSNPGASGAEGTAMLEIVHDLAPGADLWFGNFAMGTGLDFTAAVTCLAANADVVVDDISFFNAGPYDGTSFISANTSAQLAKAANPIRGYATAVGNFAVDHYREAFADSGFTLSDGASVWHLHRFDATAATTDSGRHFPCATGSAINCGNSLLLKSGGTLEAFLEWDDPFSGSSNDYDLFLFDEQTGTVVAQSTGSQSGTQPPTEMVSFTNPHGDGFFDLLVGRLHGAARTLSVFVNCQGACQPSTLNTTMNFNTGTSSIAVEGDAGGGVLSVGAIAAADAGNVDIEFFSSRGPTVDGRLKPDITGIDGVSVTGVGGFSSPFFGTSAAAPHIGGIMALLLELRPDLKAGGSADPASARMALRQALTGSAVDLGLSGPDDTFGAGRADAFGAAEQLQTSTVACVADARTLCIDNLPGDQRYEIRVHYSSPARQLDGDGSATSLSSLGITEGGAFAFFAAANPEMLVKVLDGCKLGGHHWVFFAAVTDVGFTVTVRDTVTSAVKTYSNPDGQAASPVQDTSAFAC